MNDTNETEEMWEDYDIEESWNYYDWSELAPALVIYSITFCLGLTGNIVIIASTLCPKLRPLPSTPTNIFLGGLATADLILIIFCIPIKIAKLFSFTWTMGAFICKSVHYVQNVAAISSVLTLTAMSIERYYAIVHPMRAHYTCTISQARRIVIATWTASFFLAIPIILTQIHKPVGVRVPSFWCVRDSDSQLLWRIHELYMLLLVLVVPLTVMGFCYTAICWEIWRVMKRRYHMTSRSALSPTVPSNNGECILMTDRGRESSRRSRTKRGSTRTEGESRTIKQVVKMLVAVVVLFAICWSPLLIDNVLTACINPIVYGFMSKHFRESFLAAACGGWWCCCRRKVYTPPVKRHLSLSQTRTTSVR
ncbi:hypothetical protein G9C98_001146 [Cotesia typhae]|uniref:G-protein coupled receptors family 1 profile domain-containing protein n=1 Tax=Cotesia typhae TaxID=2053667 RepID=A0A8J5V7P0_9HYME|nr:hypothetical protein G9C98_001146 [Cotesia typhae]